MTEATKARTIAEIEADVCIAGQQVLATAAAHQEAQQWLNGLRTELHAARVKADLILPRATIMRRGKPHQVVCISRRTAKTIFTRTAGSDPRAEQAWKESKHSPGEWRMHPRQDFFLGGDQVLRIEDQA